jgi:ABC-type branched-subunit amino acid transport system ATPase component
MPDAPFLAVENLTKAFGGVRAVDDVSFTLAANEMRCVIGPNGCGKTTLFNLITGYLPPTAGTIRLEGADIPGRPLYEIARAGIIRKFQVPSVFPGLTVDENLRIALAGKANPGKVRASFPSGFATRQRQAHAGRAERTHILERVRLDRHRHDTAGTLSHGQKQWLELALVLAGGPRLMLLDEPAAGMTRAEKQETIRLIRSVHEESGISALVIEHDMDFVEALECEVMVMMLGRVVASGSYAAMRDNPMVREAYLGNGHREGAGHG